MTTSLPVPYGKRYALGSDRLLLIERSWARLEEMADKDFPGILIWKEWIHLMRLLSVSGQIAEA